MCNKASEIGLNIQDEEINIESWWTNNNDVFKIIKKKNVL